MKRIFDPPINLKEFIKVIRLRFKDLDEEILKISNIDLSLKNEFENENDNINLMKYLDIAYEDSDEDENEIHETESLMEAFRYAEKRESKRVLKFFV